MRRKRRCNGEKGEEADEGWWGSSWRRSDGEGEGGREMEVKYSEGGEVKEEKKKE